jgi:hypothetical protein
MKRFNLLNKADVIDRYCVGLCEIWTLRWILILILPGKLLEGVSKFQPKRVQVIMN